MTPLKWMITGVVAIALLAGAAAAAVYFAMTSSRGDFERWEAANKIVLTTELQAERDSFQVAMRGVATQLAAAAAQAAAGGHADTTVIVDQRPVDSLRQLLEAARNDSAKLQLYPPLVAGQDRQIGDLQVASASWHAAFDTEHQATTNLIARVSADTIWEGRILARLDSAPKPPRVNLGQLLTHPHPYVRAEWGVGGFRATGGACLGSCGP